MNPHRADFSRRQDDMHKSGSTNNPGRPIQGPFRSGANYAIF